VYSSDMEFRQRYLENGYIIIPNIIDFEDVKRIFLIFVRYLKSKNLINFFPEDLNDLRLHNELIHLRRNNPEEFSKLYDSMQSNAALLALTYSAKIESVMKQIFENPCLSATGHMIRMDAPLDTRNTINWHQEIPYYPQNVDGDNAAVMWFPLNNHKAEHGPVIVAPGSHKLGVVKLEHVPASNLKSEQYVVPEKLVSKFTEFQVVIPVGDAVIFNMNLFHASGFNSSDQIRFSGTIRYHNMAATDWSPGLNFWKSSKNNNVTKSM
jgi:ectoine hydroxylase-related dioxygenase (phytanoyl-CoA dioxygenase family)